MDLKLGILEHEPGWKLVLDRIGCWWEKVEDLRADLHHRYSVLIINRPVDKLERRTIQNYMAEGGAIVDQGHVLHKLDGHDIGRTFKKTFYPKPNPFYTPHEPIDIYRNIWLHPKGKTCEGALHWEKRGKGAAAFLGWEISPLMLDERATQKMFYHPEGKAPFERVGLVSKAEIQRFIAGLIKWLHIVRRIPFVHKWHLPDAAEQLFMFRVDTDFGTRDQISELSALTQSYSIPVTWFLHVEAHHGWLNEFPHGKRDEIAAHGFEHKTKENFEYNKKNIARALKNMVNAGHTARGFAAPYGMWNAGLAQAIQANNLNYSSEFALGYNYTPFFAEGYAPKMDLLQIPVHPICIGSFRRLHTPVEKIEAYFTAIIARFTALNEPVVLYHHPRDNHLDILGNLFDHVNQPAVHKTTFNHYANFWRDRQHTSFVARWENNEISLINQALAHAGVAIAVHKNLDDCVLWTGSPSSRLTPEKRISPDKIKPIPIEKMRAIRGFKPRLIKQTLLDSINRIRS